MNLDEVANNALFPSDCEEMVSVKDIELYSFQTRVNGLAPFQLDAATILANRGVAESPKGFYWASDQRLKAASYVKFSQDNLESYFTAILARVLLIQAENSAFSSDRQQNESVGWIPQMEITKKSDFHHLYLKDQAEAVAEKVQSFLNNRR
tara:strand:+ start:12087 stop:12539 length:453 start_codon:yes stop_codon:yes gene_type:complete